MTTTPAITQLHGDRVYVDAKAEVDELVAEWRDAVQHEALLPRDTVWNVAAQVWSLLVVNRRTVINYENAGCQFAMIVCEIVPVARELFDGADVTVAWPDRGVSFAWATGRAVTPPEVGRWPDALDKEVMLLAEFLTTLSAVPHVFVDASPLDR